MNARCDAVTPKIPCIHRTADGVFRGAYIGVVWGVYFARDHLRETARDSGHVLGGVGTARRVGRYVGAHVVGFAAFLGGYNALQCTLEHIFGPDSGMTPFTAGATLGALASCVLPTRPTGLGIAAGSMGTAVTCYAIHRAFMPASSAPIHPPLAAPPAARR